MENKQQKTEKRDKKYKMVTEDYLKHQKNYKNTTKHHKITKTPNVYALL